MTKLGLQQEDVYGNKTFTAFPNSTRSKQDVRPERHPEPRVEKSNLTFPTPPCGTPQTPGLG